MKSSFVGKVAVVTGGASGIGRATALAFAKEGARVVVADVLTEDGEETVHLIQDGGGEAFFVRCDVSQDADAAELIERAVAVYGRVDCAHNNAGILGTLATTAECDESNWDRVIAINLKGVWLCMKYELRQMLKQGGGTIVNTASNVGLVGAALLPAYCASKGGVIQLTRAAALEYATSGIRINAVCPGLVQTPMVENMAAHDPEFAARAEASQPIGRIAQPEEIAAAVLWLCSDASSFVTGHPLAVDGGILAQ